MKDNFNEFGRGDIGCWSVFRQPLSDNKFGVVMKGLLFIAKRILVVIDMQPDNSKDWLN